MDNIQVQHMDKAVFPWSFIYFHGEAERIAGRFVPESAPDLSGGNVPRPEEVGIYRVYLHGHKAFVFVWMMDSTYSKYLSGLICLARDSSAMRQAYKKYLKYRYA